LDGPIEATKHILEEGGILALWAGTPSRTVEGKLKIAAIFHKNISATCLINFVNVHQ
jgi:hypothetical protein